MADPAVEAGEPPGVEMFGTLELKLSTANATGYSDVYKLKNRKKKPYQAKIYRPWRKDHITIGTFASAHEAAVAVARQRLDGIEDCPSPDKSRTNNSALPRPAFDLQTLSSLIRCCSYLVRKEKQKLLAATTTYTPMPTTFQGFENTPLQLPLAQPQAWTAVASARAFATGAVGVALPASAPALLQAALPRAWAVRPP
jgi:hypothetical protein